MTQVFIPNHGSLQENSHLSTLSDPGDNFHSHWIQDDCGLIPDQYQDSQWAESQLQRQQINQKLEKMRKFKEYELIQEDEYLITIEYWYASSENF